jgi:hypothetical protein
MTGKHRTEAHRRWLVRRAHVEDGVPLSRRARAIRDPASDVAAVAGLLPGRRAGWPEPGRTHRPGPVRFPAPLLPALVLGRRDHRGRPRDGLPHVLSEGPSDGQDYGGARVTNPFR